jgi:hypothetical protein
MGEEKRNGYIQKFWQSPVGQYHVITASMINQNWPLGKTFDCDQDF